MSELIIPLLQANSPDFAAKLDALLAWESVSDPAVVTAVEEIVTSVKRRGDAAVLEYTAKFDGVEFASAEQLELSSEQIQGSLALISEQQRAALESAAQRIRDYHQRQLQTSWSYTEADGTVLGQQITALERVGVYVPGGKATYPSTVLMDVFRQKLPVSMKLL
jgi:histidinol dehydrogenase